MPATFRPAHQRSKQERGREHDRRRSQLQAWRRWYKTSTWRGIRARQLADEPLCRICGSFGLTVPATVVDHEGRHGGDWQRFVEGPFRSLCKSCHDGQAQREEHAARGAARP